MNYEMLNDMLIQNVPELKQAYLKELEWWDGEQPGAHNIFGDVLNPYLIERLDQMDDEKVLKRVFNFLESMALSEDEKVKEVLTCTVLERLGDDTKILERAEAFMGENTKKLSQDVEKGLGRL
jgi:hypothetical protein